MSSDDSSPGSMIVMGRIPPGLPVLLCGLLSAGAGFQFDGRHGQLCAFTHSLLGAQPDLANEQRGVVQENGTIHCGAGSWCYGLWEKRADGEMQVLNQGCWTHVGNQQECHGDRCVLLAASPSKMWKANYRFCCCTHKLCNTNFTEAPPTTNNTPALMVVKNGQNCDQMGCRLWPQASALIALVTIAIAAILIMGLFLGYRMKRKHKHSLSMVAVLECGNKESSVDLEHLKLLELIGRGRCGAVFRGSVSECSVAIKVFHLANRQNFSNECSIYFLPLLQTHDNIANFLSADERTANDGQPEFLIVMEFYPHGCLSQYLSSHTVDWLTCCRMLHGVTRGLAFLHTELRRGEDYKPAVAHRDLTSGNVLVRADLTCVLADFGLSMRLTENWTCCHGDGDTLAISEVGTVRYMSPELLGGALNLRDCKAALKQVDVYALGLMFWETFRRCPDLFPGQSVPEFQLAFQEELGNHPSFEEMQTLVVREKFRPRFPDSWKDTSLAIRSLKETMEDCWDQDAEARISARCAEERLCDLTTMTMHTAVHNRGNLVHNCRPPQPSPASCFIEDIQVGVVRNIQGNAHIAGVIRSGRSAPEVPEKNGTCEQSPPLPGNADASQWEAGTSTLPPPPRTVSERPPTGGAVPACLQLTDDDLQATKMEVVQVKNLRENSQEDSVKLAEKSFTSRTQSSALLLVQATDLPSPALGVFGGAVSTTHPLPDQPQRPSSLHMLHRTNHRQVQMGIAKMNTVATVLAAEPHLVTTVTNTNWRCGASSEVTSGCNASVTTLVTREVTGRGWSNPAGPQVDQEQVAEMEQVGTSGGGEDGSFNLINFSPDEHEPLLRSERPANTDRAPCLHRQNQTGSLLPGRGSNYNNNNNRLNTCRAGAPTGLHKLSGPPQPVGPPFSWCRGSGQCHQQPVEFMTGPDPNGSQTAEETDLQGPTDQASSSGTSTVDPDSLGQVSPSPPSSSPGPLASDPQPPSLILESPTLNPDCPDKATEPSDPDYLLSEPFASGSEGALGTSELLTPKLLQTLKEPICICVPERPRSLDLSSFYASSDFVLESDGGGLSARGEKIKRRVKTPYTLKKWRPASWVVPTDNTVDRVPGSSGLVRARTAGFPNINQSKSSMAVFLVVGGATATATSEPDGMTSF